MPTLEVPREKIQPTVQPGLQLAPGAFGAEGRALQRFGQTITGFAGTIFNIGEKIKLLNESNQIDEGVLAAEEFLDEAATNRLKDTDFENHGPQFFKDWDQFVTGYMPGVKSKTAQEELTKIFGRQRAVQHTRITADAFMKAGWTERARQPLVMQQSVEDELAETDADEQENIRSRFKERLVKLQSAGHLAEWQVQDQLKIRAMMMMQTVAGRWPEAAIEALKSREMLASILTQEDIDLLTDGDINFLRENAQKELSYAQDRINAQKIEAIAEIKARVASMAGRGDFAGAQKIINNSIELLGVKDHGILSNNLTRTSEYFGETGINYFKVTHKPSVYADLRGQILTGTLKDDALIWQKVGVNGISESDATRLAKMIPEGGKESDFKKSAAAKTYQEFLDSIYGGDAATYLFARETGYRWLEDALNSNPEWTLRQQQEEAMRIAIRVEAAAKAGEIAERPEDLPRTLEELSEIQRKEFIDTILPGILRTQRELIKKGRPKRQKGKIKTITTQEQYDALPSGTRYRDANGATGTKR